MEKLALPEKRYHIRPCNLKCLCFHRDLTFRVFYKYNVIVKV
jgi:hypothetical protein